MLAALLGVTAAALLAWTGLAVASSLGLRDWPRVLLGAYVVAFAEIVVLVLLLSAFGAVRRPALLVALAAVAAAAAAAWWSRGQSLPSPRNLRFLFGGPLAALVVVVGLTLCYVGALAVGTPATTWDSLVYHLTRAAMWRQDGAAGYIDHAYDGRLNANPPNAEIAFTSRSRSRRTSGSRRPCNWARRSPASWACTRSPGGWGCQRRRPHSEAC